MNISGLIRYPIDRRDAGLRSDPVVYEVQRALQTLGFADLETDGVFGRVTERALRGFQRDNGLPETGSIDDATLDALRRATAGEDERESPETTERIAGPGLRFDAGVGALAAEARVASALRIPRPSPEMAAAVERAREAYTKAHVSPAWSNSFARIEAANTAVESGGQNRASTMATTAGVPASYGIGQLTVQSHLAALRHLPAATLREIGISRADLDAMMRRGSAAAAWYHAIVDLRQPSAAALARAGLSRTDAERARALVEARRYDDLVDELGEAFERSTGLPAGALADVAVSALLQRPELKAGFDAAYAATAGRRREREREAAAALVANHPELEPLVEALGGGRAAMASIGAAFHRKVRNEHLQAWYARGAQGSMPQDRFAALFTALDPLTTRIRSVQNFEPALAATRGADDLGGVELERMVARVARRFHGRPNEARDTFFIDGDLNRPRYHSAAALDRAVGALTRNERSDTALRHAFDRLLTVQP